MKLLARTIIGVWYVLILLLFIGIVVSLWASMGTKDFLTVVGVICIAVFVPPTVAWAFERIKKP